MKNIAEKVVETSERELKKFKNDSKYNELNEFLKEMKSKGLVKQNSYTLPPLDTVGRRLYQMK